MPIRINIGGSPDSENAFAISAGIWDKARKPL